MKTFNKFLYLLTSHERKRMYLLIGMILIMALFDMLGVASIMPFMAVLSNPELVESNSILNKLFKISGIFGVKTNQEFLYTLGILVFLFLITSLIFRALTLYAQVRFLTAREYLLGKRLIEGYLHQPYSWFLRRHSAELGKTILSETGKIVSKGLAPLLNLISQSAVTIAIITLLILVDPKLTLIVGLVLGSAYGIVYKFTGAYISRIGKENLGVNESRFAAISEAFGAAKEIKLGGLEKIYIERFSEPAEIHAKHSGSMSIVSSMPRFALEAIIFGGMILVTLYLMSKSSTFSNAVPILALYAFAGYRLMPALQQIYLSFTHINYISPSLDKLYEDVILTSRNTIQLYLKHATTDPDAPVFRNHLNILNSIINSSGNDKREGPDSSSSNNRVDKMKKKKTKKAKRVTVITRLTLKPNKFTLPSAVKFTLRKFFNKRACCLKASRCLLQVIFHCFIILTLRFVHTSCLLKT